jgi:8-oxo-dGTP diphosphatase
MKKILFRIWRNLPFWMQRMAAAILRTRYQVAVGAMILNDQGQLLLCQHTYRRLHPWGLPGGDLKVGEDPVDGIKREILEETGLVMQSARLLLAESSAEIHQVTLTYLCTVMTGTFVANEEVSGIGFFDRNKLPDFFQEHRVTIEKCLAILGSEE